LIVARFPPNQQGYVYDRLATDLPGWLQWYGEPEEKWFKTRKLRKMNTYHSSA
jgi:hypothetical protein